MLILGYMLRGYLFKIVIKCFLARMNKKQGILIGIAFVLLFTWIALATPSPSSDVEIYACFEFLFAIIGVVAAMCLVRQREQM